MELLKGQTLLRKGFFGSETQMEDPGNSVSAEEALKGKIVGLFYSASWCPPCQQFLPQLNGFYDALKRRKCPFEIVFISMDDDDQGMADNFVRNHGDWLTLPFVFEEKENLVHFCTIECIPKLIIVNEEGTIISHQGRKDIADLKGPEVNLFKQWQQMDKSEQQLEEGKAAHGHHSLGPHPASHPPPHPPPNPPLPNQK